MSCLLHVDLYDEVKDRLNEPAQGLSGGQQQRLCLARSLVLQPEVLLLDEPCSALDPMASAVVEDLIAQQRGRYTVVLVTHNLAQAKRLGDLVGVFWTENGHGALVEYGDATTMFSGAQHPAARAYLNGDRG